MTIEDEIRRDAEEITARLQNRAAALYEEYRQAQSKAQELKAEYDTASVAANRFADFHIKIGPNYQCASCWIEHKCRSSLAANFSDGRHDILRCPSCGHEVRFFG